MIAPGPPPFDAVVMRGHGLVVVRVSGELDCATAPHLARALDEALSAGPGRLIVDLRDVPFVDPAGARPLRSLADPVDAKTRLRIRGATGTVRRVLDLLGLAALLDP